MPVLYHCGPLRLWWDSHLRRSGRLAVAMQRPSPSYPGSFEDEGERESVVQDLDDMIDLENREVLGVVPVLSRRGEALQKHSYIG